MIVRWSGGGLIRGGWMPPRRPRPAPRQPGAAVHEHRGERPKPLFEHPSRVTTRSAPFPTLRPRAAFRRPGRSSRRERSAAVSDVEVKRTESLTRQQAAERLSAMSPRSPTAATSRCSSVPAPSSCTSRPCPLRGRGGGRRRRGRVGAGAEVVHVSGPCGARHVVRFLPPSTAGVTAAGPATAERATPKDHGASTSPSSCARDGSASAASGSVDVVTKGHALRDGEGPRKVPGFAPLAR